MFENLKKLKSIDETMCIVGTWFEFENSHKKKKI